MSAVKDRRKVTQTTAWEAIQWVRVLQRLVGCAGEPACAPDVIDIETGKREHNLCTGCTAREWLERRRLL